MSVCSCNFDHGVSSGYARMMGKWKGSLGFLMMKFPLLDIEREEGNGGGALHCGCSCGNGTEHQTPKALGELNNSARM